MNLRSVRRVLLEGEEANGFVLNNSEECGKHIRICHVLPGGFFNAKPIRQRAQNWFAQRRLTKQRALDLNVHGSLTTSSDRRERRAYRDDFMTPDEIVEFVDELGGTIVVVASEEDGDPEILSVSVDPSLTRVN